MDDMISREALLDELRSLCGAKIGDGIGNQTTVSRIFQRLGLIDLIMRLPAVDAVPVVHARWIFIQNGSGVCSACNRNDHIDSLAAYCRYCGAKMDGERREAEPWK